jgi:aromatic ring-opening dioxygenase LigB subunit
MPLSLTVGAWLVSRVGVRTDAIAVAVGPDFFRSPAAGALDSTAGERVGLVVMGDGTARRSRAAPGYWDERAEGFDAAVLAALAAGDSAALAALDLELAAELLCAGAPAWAAAGALLSGAPMDAEVRYEEVPFGVQYIVASWSARG